MMKSLLDRPSVLLLVILYNLGSAMSFLVAPVAIPRSLALLVASATPQTEQHVLLRDQIDKSIRQNRDPRALISQLEELQSTKEPNRQAGFQGGWHTWYTGAFRSHQRDAASTGSYSLNDYCLILLCRMASIHDIRLSSA